MPDVRDAPSGDDPDGAEPLPGAVDARFTLASERTMLAWLRTALGLIAAGVAVMHLFEPFGNAAARTTLGICLLAVGAFTAIVGAVRWHEINRALQKGGPLPGPWPIWTLTALIVVVGIAFAFWQ
ncbi:YidH family protein [Gordonia caeni]|uniref:DUF202 domain-containing protein n=1 Tax=Gordonia caeni TaxID=1007097 RepID=A0ABP7NLY4_9ACTN